MSDNDHDSYGKENPWVKFFWDDWLNDEDLQPCSLAAQGLWMNLLALMRRGRPYGFLNDKRGPWTPERLAGKFDKSAGEISALLEELERNNVFSRNKEGVVYSRRLRRDYDKSQKRSDAGSNSNRWGTRDEDDQDHIPRSQRLADARKLGTHTPEEFHEMVDFFGGLCVRCGSEEELLRGHIIPLYKHGSDEISNIQPLCRSCNSSKGPDETDHRLRHFKASDLPPKWIAKRIAKRITETASTRARASDLFCSGSALAYESDSGSSEIKQPHPPNWDQPDCDELARALVEEIHPIHPEFSDKAKAIFFCRNELLKSLDPIEFVARMRATYQEHHRELVNRRMRDPSAYIFPLHHWFEKGLYAQTLPQGRASPKPSKAANLHDRLAKLKGAI